MAYVAKMLLQMYYDAAGLFSNGAWDAYWTPRSKRDFCASWFGVRLVRAHGGSSPVTGMQDTRIRHVRTAVGRLADVDRELTLLWLATRVSASRAAQEVFAPEAIRLAAARNLGRARLLEILRGVPPTSDPDLLPGAKGEHPCARIAWFVLGNAGALLDRGDVEELLELDARAEELADRNWSWPASGPMWRVAAAQLDPARALMHLEVAFERCGALDGFCRDDVLVWAWRLLGDGFDSAWTDRFWHEERERAHTPTQLLGALREDASPRARATFAALLRHPGLETADGETLVQLARTANVWTYPPVLDEDELRRLWHPSGLSRVRTDEQLARAAEQWPRETSAMLERMSAWRAQLRATLSATETTPERR